MRRKSIFIHIKMTLKKVLFKFYFFKDFKDFLKKITHFHGFQGQVVRFQKFQTPGAADTLKEILHYF